MDASIIVCTYNRAESLRHTLKCLAALQNPDGSDWEVIVVDNNSSDQTHQLVKDFSSVFPRLRYEYEEQQGLSYARNLGIKSAKGDIVLFTDDDVCPEPDWLETVITSMSRYTCDACGGYIAPIWETPPPDWLTERFHGFLAIKMDTSGPYQVTTVKDAPFGANMAFRRSVFDRVGKFDTSRGRKGSELASGEDGEMFERMLAADMKIMYLPDANVHHRVEAYRVTKKYLRKWRYQTSLNIARSRGLSGKRHLLGIPLYVFPQLIRAIKNAIVARFTGPEDEAFNREMIVWHFIGTMRGLYQTRSCGRDSSTVTV